MSARALHLNLLNAQERRPASQVRLKVILPIAAGLATAFVLLWGGFLGSQLWLINGQVDRVRREIGEYDRQKAESERILAKFRDQQAEADQFAYYEHGRVTRGELLQRLADAIPERITLLSLSIPPQPDLPPDQLAQLSVTQAVECAELRLRGLACGEQDIFNLMNALKGNAFTGLVSIVEQPDVGQLESPRVLAFRQEARTEGIARQDVFFDIVYDLKPREFAK